MPRHIMSAAKDSDETHLIAVIGMGCLFPRAAGIERWWENLREGVDAITEVPDSHWPPTDYYDADSKTPDKTYARRGGFIDPVDFDPLFYGISPNNLEATDSTQLLGLYVTRMALADAGYASSQGAGDGRDFDRGRCSVILGVTGTLELVIPLGARLGHPHWRRALAAAGVDEDTAEQVVQGIADSYVPWQENSFPGLLGNVVAGRIANRFDLRGTNCVVDAACASSLSAVHMAMMELQSGRCDMVISGGMDTFNDIFMYICFSKTPALSPSGDSRPFSRDGDGTTLGEGLGVVVLKRLADARRDGDRIHAVIRGMGTASDGRGEAVYAPRAQGQRQCLADAYRRAAVTPDSVELLEAHGTGTAVGDAIESSALIDVYRAATTDADATGPWCALGSVKSMIGHTKAAAGAASLIKCVLALRHRVLPPTLKISEPLEQLQQPEVPFYLNTRKRPWVSAPDRPRRAALSAFGFGGSNFHCVLEEAPPGPPLPHREGRQLLFCFSAAEPDALGAALEPLEDADWHALRRLAAASRQAFRAADRCRLAFVLSARADRAALLSEVRERLRGVSAPRPRCWYRDQAAEGDLAFLFPGQGSQYPGMFRDLACQFPAFGDCLAGLGTALSDLPDIVWPPSEQADDRRLRDTRHAQPSLGALGVAAHQMLTGFGVHPAAVAGHSFGELPALYAAGCISAGQCLQLAMQRGAIMAQAADSGEEGAMAAVFAEVGEVQALLDAGHSSLSIVNYNAPKQLVVSGAADQLQPFLAACTGAGVRAVRLPVSGAFHSPQFAAAVAPFAEVAGEVEFSAPRLAVYSNTLGARYPEQGSAAREILARQLAEPVHFSRMVEAMYADGVRCFVEIGPDQRLSGLLRQILEQQEVAVLALDASRGRRHGVADLAALLAQLAVLGYMQDLSAWDADFAAEADPPPPRMTIRVCGANFPPAPARPRPDPGGKGPGTGKQSGQEIATGTAGDGACGPVTGDGVSDSGTGAGVSSPAMEGGASGSVTDLAEGSGTRAQYPVSGLVTGDGVSGSGMGAGVSSPVVESNASGSVAGDGATSSVAGAVTISPVAKGGVSNPVAADGATSLVAEGSATSSVAGGGASSPATEGGVSGSVAGLAEGSGIRAQSGPVEQGSGGEPAAGLALQGILALQKMQEDTARLHQRYLQLQEQTQQQVAALLQLEAQRLGAPVTPGVSSVSGSSVSGVAPGVSSVPVSSVSGVAPGVSSVSGSSVSGVAPGVSSVSGSSVSGVAPEVSSVPVSSVSEVVPEVSSVSGSSVSEVAPEVSSVSGSSVSEVAPGVSSAPAPSVSEVVPEASAAPASAAGEDLGEVLLSVVADKTGYPREMLSLDMSLDTDLGIDSIKRVEILSALVEKLPWAANVPAEEVGTFKFLKHIVEFIAVSAPKEHATVASVAAASGAQSGSMPAVTPAAAEPAPEQSPQSDQDLLQLLLSVVADKTGYPPEMIEPGMRLDTDLGIDSIKRVEILSALQERLPALEPLSPDAVGRLNTLQAIAGHIAGTLSAQAPAQEPPADEPPQHEPPQPAPVDEPPADEAAPVHCQWVQAVTAKEAWPAPRVIDTDAVLRLVAGDTDRARGLMAALGERFSNAARLEPHADALQTGEAIDLLILMQDPGLSGDDWLGLLQAARPRLNEGAWLLGVSFLGGDFGLGGLAEGRDPGQAALNGLLKTAAREWSGVHCRIVDVEMDVPAGLLCRALLCQGPVELGLRADGQRCSVQCVPAPVQQISAPPVQADEVVVISGGARGVASAVAWQLAHEWRVQLHLLGRTTLSGEPDWARTAQDEPALRQALALTRPGLAPAALGEHCREVLAQREIRDSLQRLQSLGVQAHYHCVDVRDESAVRAALAGIQEQHGPVRGLIHAAGVLSDRLIADQTPEQFQAVYQTKVAGLRHLLSALEPAALRFLALFSSTTARLGRRGQGAYAAANEVLNKMAQQQALLYPDCRCLALNWGPWDGGMVTPALRALFRGEGVDVIGMQAGARSLLEALCVPETVPEMVLAAGPAGAGQTQQDAGLRLAFARRIDTRSCPVLADHILDQRAVLPVALILEWLAHGAMHNHPGMQFHGISNFRLYKGVRLAAGESRDLEIHAGELRGAPGQEQVSVLLRSAGELCARAEVILTGELPAPAGPVLPRPEAQGGQRAPYETGQLFHGPALQGLRRLLACGEDALLAEVKSAPVPREWMQEPVRSDWLADPLVLDGAFQALILWSCQDNGALSLPTAIGEYRQYCPFPRTTVFIVARITGRWAHRLLADLEFLDEQGRLIADMSGYEAVRDASLQQAFRKNRLPAAAVIS